MASFLKDTPVPLLSPILTSHGLLRPGQSGPCLTRSLTLLTVCSPFTGQICWKHFSALVFVEFFLAFHGFNHSKPFEIFVLWLHLHRVCWYSVRYSSLTLFCFLHWLLFLGCALRVGFPKAPPVTSGVFSYSAVLCLKCVIWIFAVPQKLLAPLPECLPWPPDTISQVRRLSAFLAPFTPYCPTLWFLRSRTISVSLLPPSLLKPFSTFLT